MDIQPEKLLAVLGENLAEWTLEGNALKQATIEGDVLTIISDAGRHSIPVKGRDRFTLRDESRRHDLETERIGIWDCHVGFSPPDPINPFSCLNDPPPTELKHMLVNRLRSDKNDILIAAEQEEQRRRREQERAAFDAARSEHHNRFQREHVIPFVDALVGQTIESLTLANGVLVIQVKNSPPLSIRVRSIGVRSNGGIIDSPELHLTCGEKELSGHASIYRQP